MDEAGGPSQGVNNLILGSTQQPPLSSPTHAHPFVSEKTDTQSSTVFTNATSRPSAPVLISNVVPRSSIFSGPLSASTSSTAAAANLHPETTTSSAPLATAASDHESLLRRTLPYVNLPPSSSTRMRRFDGVEKDIDDPNNPVDRNDRSFFNRSNTPNALNYLFKHQSEEQITTRSYYSRGRCWGILKLLEVHSG
jgi:hypothetical protein